MVVDGRILKDNLSLCNKNEWWLIRELDKRGTKLRDVMLATVKGDSLLVYTLTMQDSFLPAFE